MGEKKTTMEDMAEKEINKKFGKAIANRMMQIKQYQAKIKKLEKEIEKIKKGEFVPTDEETINNDEDDSSSSNPKCTYINFILDESGSMQIREQETINSVNEYVQTMAKQKGNIKFTLTTFNSDNIKFICKNEDIHSVKQLNNSNYIPTGCTPLYDVVGKNIVEMDKFIKDNKGIILFVILTDGEENASKEYKKETIQKMIKDKEALNWKFVYMGVGQDAWGGGSNLGISNSLNTSSRCGGLGIKAMSMFSSGLHNSGGNMTFGSWKSNNKQMLGRLKR